MKHVWSTGCVAGCIVLFAAASLCAEPITLNFDTDFSGRTLSSGTLLNDAYTNDLFTFGADDSVVRTGDGVASKPNFAQGGNGMFSPIDIFFARPVSYLQASNVTNSGWTLTIFDARGGSLGSTVATDFPQSAGLGFRGAIWSARFARASDGNFGIDDLMIDAAPVPEPSTLMMLFAGCAGLVARVVRGRRRTELLD